MQNSLIKDIAKLENLHWAWQKLSASYKNSTDIWLDQIQISAFEGDLEHNLQNIRQDLLKGEYKLSHLYPVAYPKTKDENNNYRTRPAFYVHVRDQVTWIAVINVIGHFYDYEMPFWSYGHRLFITTWIEKENNDDIGVLKYGWYRNSTKNLYRSWKQSWPRFRRHLSLTIKAMTGNLQKEINDNTLSEQDLKEYETNEKAERAFLKNEYLVKGYWKENNDENLYWCSFDLKKFYPSIDTNVLLNNIAKYNPKINNNDETYKLIERLLDFSIAKDSGWCNEEIESVFDDYKKPRIGLPTGLIVSGFLSNIAMLDVDKATNNILENKKAAIFRFVDDYVLLAKDIASLKKSYKAYQNILNEKLENTNIGEEKTEPEEFKKWTKDEDFDKEELEKQCKIDPDNPTPLVTHTLHKLSLIASQDIKLLTAEENQNLINDLNHFLLTDFAEHEIKKETQVAFALTTLSKLIPNIKVDYSMVHMKNIEIGKVVEKKDNKENEKKLKKLKEERKDLINEEEKKYAQQINKHLFYFLNVVYDNFAKPKLWLRLIEFISRTGSENLKKIFDLIDKLRNKDKINNLNYQSLNVLNIDIICNISLEILKSYLRNYVFYDHRKKKFIETAFAPKMITAYFERLKGKKYDTIKTKTILIITLRFISDNFPKIISFKDIERYLDNKDLKIFNLNSNDNNKILFWSWRKLNYYGKVNSYWKELSKYSDLKKNLGQVIHLLSDEITDKLLPTEDFRINNRLLELNCINNNENYNLQKYLIDSSKNEHTTEHDLFFSEYASLKILKQLIQYVDENFHQSINNYNPIEDICMHPACFKLKKPEKALKSWDELRRHFREKQIELEYSKENIWTDRRYIPQKIIDYQDKEIAEIYAIGIILWQLAYKQAFLPVDMYIDNGKYFLNFFSDETAINYYPSSYTQSIIESCLSPINRESKMWFKKIINGKFYKNIEDEQLYKAYPPIIVSLHELEKRVDRAIDLMKKEQLNMRENIGRQLVYISLEKPTLKNDLLRDG